LIITIILLIILALPIVPMYFLYYLTKGVDSRGSNSLCITVLLIFPLSFSAYLSLFTTAKRHKFLAAAAA
jgi:hypothetical protein